MVRLGPGAPGRKGVGAYVGLLRPDTGREAGREAGGDMNSWLEAAGGRLGGMWGVCRLAGAGAGAGVRRVSRGEPGPGGQERGTDWGLVALAVVVTWENTSSTSPTAGLERKNDIGEGIMEDVGGPAGVRVLEYMAGGPPPPPPPPTKLSSSASPPLTGSEAVTPKLSARLNPPPPPPGANRGLAGLLFIINSLKTRELRLGSSSDQDKN